MNSADRLQARSLLLDELYLRASKAEHDLAQERKNAEERESLIKELTAENAALRGEPKP